MIKQVFVCSTCGSENIWGRYWVQENTGAVGNSLTGEGWCDDCGEYCDILSQSEYIDNITDEEETEED